MAYQNQKVKARQVVSQTQQTQTLGVTANVPMGKWNATTKYQKLNTVRSHEATYQAKKDNTGVEPTVTQGWQEVWQVVAYDGGGSGVSPDGTYPDMSVGNDGTGRNIAEQFAEIRQSIQNEPSIVNFGAADWKQASSENYYLGAVNKSITLPEGKRIVQVLDENNQPRGTWQGNTIYANYAFSGVAIII